MRATHTPEGLRLLATQTGPQWEGEARAALNVAADIMDAANAVINQAPANEQEPVVWHSPGLGEVHSAGHTKMIFCADVDDAINDDLAKYVCNVLNDNHPAPAAQSKEFKRGFDLAMSVRSAYVVQPSKDGEPIGVMPDLVAPAKDDFASRGTLASLKCWHRLSGEEADDLVTFFAAPAKELTDAEIDYACRDIWGSDYGVSLSANLQRVIARAVLAARTLP